MEEDESKNILERWEDENERCKFKIIFPNNVAYYIFDVYGQLAFIGKDGIGHYLPRKKTYEDTLKDYEGKVPYRKTLIKLIHDGIVEEMFYDLHNVYEIKPLEKEDVHN